MTWTIKTRGARSQLKLQDFECDTCGMVEVLAPICDVTKCPCCDGWAVWRISAPHGVVRQAEVVRGGVARPDSPMYLDTRPLAEGMSREEWKAKREKIYAERRWKESKAL